MNRKEAALKQFAMGTVIPATPLVLDANRKFDPSGQKRLNGYYLEAGAGGIATAVHSTQFEIRNPEFGLFETVIGTDGIYLSGGEQQRIAIARIILQDAPVIILDEATAYADPENEVLVQKAFEEMAVGKTVIMIAHRLTTVKNADTIYVFENGKIKEAGKHEALLEANGLYGKMWNDYQTSIRWKVGGSK